MYIVTGGAGFIGSNLLSALRVSTQEDILVVDNLEDGTKFSNIVEASISDYMDQDEFLYQVQTDSQFLSKVKCFSIIVAPLAIAATDTPKPSV